MPSRSDATPEILARLKASAEGPGNLFVKTHPKSKNLWADAPMIDFERSPSNIDA